MSGKPLTSRDQARIDSTPPLQGRGRGWGLSAGKLDQLHERGRHMRNVPTEPEKRLWRALSGSKLGGYKFRRQVVIGTAIADFLCPAKGLIVEVDGHSHTDEQADARRTAKLEALGYHVVRVTNTDVMRNIEGVCDYLLRTLETLPARRTPHPNPSPEGEGLAEAAMVQSELPSPEGEGLGVGPVHTGDADGISLEGSVG